MKIDLTNINWFKKKPKTESKSKNMFHGVDLNEWYYMGHSVISITTTEGGKELYTENNTVYFFISQSDPNGKRKFTLNIDNKKWREHQFVIECEVWEIGEGSIRRMITTNPSDYLREQVLKQLNEVWDWENKKWIPAENKETDENPQESS